MSEPTALAPVNRYALDPRRQALANDPFEPQTLTDLEKFANAVVGTDFAAAFKGDAQGCLIAMKYGRDLGLSCLQALQGIFVVNGKPSLYGDTFWALVISHPDFEDVVESVDDLGARCVIKRRGRSPSVGEFTMKDAELAGIASGNVWKKYPKNMMLWRARHRASAIFADALRGIIPREVAEDYIVGEVVTPRNITPVAFAEPEAGTKQEKAVAVEKPVAAAPAEPKWEMTAAKSSEWNKARKAGGLTTDEASAYLKALGLARTLDMSEKQFEEAMAWAKKGKVATETVKAEEPQNAEHAFCLKQWEALGSNEQERQEDVDAHTKDGVTDWETMSMALHARREERGL